MRYQDVYPSAPAIDSSDLARRAAADLLTLEYFEAEPGEMPAEVFTQHHILLNLNETPHRVENWRDGAHRDFIYRKFEVIVTPAGTRSGWRWHARSRVIVITMEPENLERFAKNELGIVLGTRQLKSVPQFVDEDLVQAGVAALEGLRSDFGSAVMFESLARIFVVKLVERYAEEESAEFAFSEGFTPKHYRRVLEYVAENYNERLTVEDIAAKAAMSPYHFSRLFKRAIGASPHQFLMAYRIERAKERLEKTDEALIDVALSCGFSDQAHFSRVFKASTGKTPGAWRSERQ